MKTTINDLIGTEEAAVILEMTPRRVRQLREELNIGVLINKTWLYDRRQVEKIRAKRGPGRQSGRKTPA